MSQKNNNKDKGRWFTKRGGKADEEQNTNSEVAAVAAAVSTQEDDSSDGRGGDSSSSFRRGGSVRSATGSSSSRNNNKEQWRRRSTTNTDNSKSKKKNPFDNDDSNSDTLFLPSEQQKKRKEKETTTKKEKKVVQNPWEWHQILVRNEINRKNWYSTQLQTNKRKCNNLQDMLNVAQQETNASYRYTSGMIMAHEQLSKNLVLPPLKTLDGEDDTDDDDDDKAFAKDNDGDDDDYGFIPPDNIDNDDNDTGVAAVLPFRDDDEGSDDITDTEEGEDEGKKESPAANKQRRASSNNKKVDKRRTSTTTTPPPPPFVNVPNPEASDEAAFILYKQHDRLQEHLASTAALHNIAKLKDIKNSVSFHSTELLDGTATKILQALQSTEDDVQRAWDEYLKTAEQVLDASNKPDTKGGTTNFSWSSSTASSSSGPSLAHVWVAEHTYRIIVSHQTKEWAQLGKDLDDLYTAVKDGERQRRLRLRHYLQQNLQRHAEAFQRIAEVHAEAIEDYVQNKDELRRKDTVNDDKKRKSKKRAILSPKERIDEIAQSTGATTYWGKTMEPQQQQSQEEHGEEVSATSGSAIDVDSISGSVSLDESDGEDEDDLPLLANTRVTKSNKMKSSGAPKREMGKRKHSKSKTSRTNKGNSKENLPKLNNVVVLDQESSKHAYFMDLLLYSGSLLESHYVEFAVVAGLDDSPAHLDVDQAVCPRSLFAPVALVVLTSDLMLHLFEIVPPRSTGESEGTAHTVTKQVILPGSSPEDALGFLLGELQIEDREQWSTKASSDDPAPASPSKLRFRYRRQSEEEEKDATLEFSNLSPSASMSLSDCVVRVTKRGDFAVKVTGKNSRGLPSDARFSKLNFASYEDQQAFIKASRVPDESSVTAL